jgi:hypothetical protein
MCLNVCICGCSFFMMFVTFWLNFSVFWMIVPSSFVVGSCFSCVSLNDSLMFECVWVECCVCGFGLVWD